MTSAKGAKGMHQLPYCPTHSYTNSGRIRESHKDSDLRRFQNVGVHDEIPVNKITLENDPVNLVTKSVPRNFII